MDFFLLFLDDGFDTFVEDKNVSIVFFDNFTDGRVLIEGLGCRSEFELWIIDDFLKFFREDGGAFLKGECFFYIDEMGF